MCPRTPWPAQFLQQWQLPRKVDPCQTWKAQGATSPGDFSPPRLHVPLVQWQLVLPWTGLLGGCLPIQTHMGTPICSRVRDPPRSQTASLGSNSVLMKSQGGSSPPRPPSPRTLWARAAPGCSPGTGESCTLHTMCVHVLIHVQAYVSVGAAPTGTGGAGGGGGGSAHLFLG